LRQQDSEFRLSLHARMIKSLLPEDATHLS
jgi:hypothetical protein